MPRPLKASDSTTYAARIGAIIRSRRLKANLSVAEAAARARVPAPTWYHFEAGVSLTVERLPAIAAALRCSPRSLLPA